MLCSINMSLAALHKFNLTLHHNSAFNKNFEAVTYRTGNRNTWCRVGRLGVLGEFAPQDILKSRRSECN